MKKILIGLTLLASMTSFGATDCTEARVISETVSIVNSIDIGGYTVQGEDMGITISKTSEGNFLVNLIYTPSNGTYRLDDQIGTRIINSKDCSVILSQSSKVEYRWK